MNLERLYHDESGRILATLIRLLGDFDLAEEAMHEAFATALEQWPAAGTPDRPRAWLISTARHKALDRIRRSATLAAKRDELAQWLSHDIAPDLDEADHSMDDDRLRLIFTCCHPGLAVEAQVALTLRTVCGLTTEEIAHAFVVPVPTLAQRLVRAKQKIRDAGIPYRVPPPEELANRLGAVLLVVYLVFNEGYASSFGDARVRLPLTREAIRLGRLLCELMPAEPEVRALLALMLLHDSRREARVDADGEIVLLDEQDRSRWDRDEIREGLALVESAFRAGSPGVYALQAAIAALHAQAQHPQATDWKQIAELYDQLLRIHATPVVEMNHAVAVAMAEGPARGLALLDMLDVRGDLRHYHLLHAARADLLRRLERWDDAIVAYQRALTLVTSDAERRFLARRLDDVQARRRTI